MGCWSGRARAFPFVLLFFVAAPSSNGQGVPANQDPKEELHGTNVAPFAPTSLADSSVDALYTSSEPSLKKPGVALALSMVVPGAGQVYNGQIAKGLVFAGLFYGGVAMVAAAGISRTHKSITGYGWMSVATIFGTYLWNMIDAETTAERRADEPDQERHSRGMDPGVGTFTLGLGVIGNSAAVRVEIGI